MFEDKWRSEGIYEAPNCWVRATEVGVMSEGFVTMRLRKFSGKTTIQVAPRMLSTASVAKAYRTGVPLAAGSLSTGTEVSVG